MRPLLSIIIALSVLTIISSCTQREIEGGYTINTSGGSQNGPLPSGPGISNQPGPGLWDPSRYNIPYVKLTNPGQEPGRSSIVSLGNLQSVSEGFSFDMTGDVEGAGIFNEWRTIENIMGAQIKQTSNADSGNVTLRRHDYSASDTYDKNSIGNLFTQSYVAFGGHWYQEREKYLDNKGYIINSFKAGALVKESTYQNFASDTISDNDYDKNVTEVTTLRNYNLSARLLGINNFESRSPNAPAIVEDYIGVYTIQRHLNYKNTSIHRVITDSWIPCCEIFS